MATQLVYNAIAGRPVPRRMACYFNAATRLHDEAAAEAWAAGAEERRRMALVRFLGSSRSIAEGRQGVTKRDTLSGPVSRLGKIT
jgi:hypothetical protein